MVQNAGVIPKKRQKCERVKPKFTPKTLLLMLFFRWNGVATRVRFVKNEELLLTMRC